MWGSDEIETGALEPPPVTGPSGKDVWGSDEIETLQIRYGKIIFNHRGKDVWGSDEIETA